MRRCFSHLAYASPKTTHRKLRATMAGAPTLSQIIEALKQQVITQTFQDNKSSRYEFDTIAPKGLRHVAQFDLLDMSFWRPGIARSSVSSKIT